MRLARKAWFDDALLLFEILVEATGEGHEALAEWQAAARAAGRRSRPPEDSEARPRPRRRRRRRGAGLL